MEREAKIAGSAVLIGSILIVALIAVQSGLLAGNVLPDLYFEEIDQGFYCGITARTEFVIEDNESWSALWTDLHNISTGYPDLPTVNFSQEVIIAVFIGGFPTGGYSANITRIDINLTGLIVYVDEVHPGEGCGVTMAFTQPYHIVRVELASPQPVDFVYNVIITNCI
ncbi:MAG: protease complex subunit PrcB family protein [Candidatus Thorarchaeota archaeon]|jgi:hypothetical protein